MRQASPALGMFLLTCAFALLARDLHWQGASSTVTRDAVLRFALDRATAIVTVQDLLNDTTLARVSVCRHPVSGSLSHDDVSFVVRCRAAAPLAINTASFVSAALDTHRGAGQRFLMTYGAGHREWFLRALRKRSDLTLLEVAPFLDRIGTR